MVTRIKEADNYLVLKNKQQEHPEKWLYPAIDYIDLNRQGLGARENDVSIRFQIDSCLLNPISEIYFFMKLCLKDTVAFKEPDSKWYEINTQLPIEPLQRHNFGENVIHLGETERENDNLLRLIMGFKNQHPVLAKLKIGIAFKKIDLIKEVPITIEGSRWIAPMNNYRGG